METSAKISNFSPIDIDDAVEREMILVVAEPNLTNYQMSVKAVRDKIANRINGLQNLIDALQPNGTENQVVLGDGAKTPAENEEGELNAPSSLFTKASSGNALDFIYGQFANNGSKLSWEEFMNLIIAEIINRGIIAQPPDWGIVIAVNISINAPVNGLLPDVATTILDEDANYMAGELVWEPNGIWNGTNSGTAMFSIIPNNGYFFIFPLPIRINGGLPTSVIGESDGSITLIKAFQATMTANPKPNMSIANPAFGITRPSTATKNDSGNYSVAIEWTPAGATFPSGVSTGTFTLTANSGYRWNSNSVLLNGTTYYGELSNDGMTLTFAYQTANIENNAGTFTDARDGKVYTWKRMPDGKKWMTVNLDYNQSGSAYYNNAGSPPFAGAGRLYTWAQAKDAVPNGWRLPTDAEWAALAIAAGGTGSFGESGTAGTKLKANHTWQSNLPTTPTGTDNYGFSALPGGYIYSGTSYNINQYGYWWTSTEYDSSDAYSRSMGYNGENVGRYRNYKSRLFSVRCLQD